MEVIHPDMRSFMLALKEEMIKGYEIILCDQPKRGLAGYVIYKEDGEVIHAIDCGEFPLPLGFGREGFLDWVRDTDLTDFYPPRALRKPGARQEPEDKNFRNPEEFVYALRERVLAGDEILSADDPKRLRIGYLCRSNTGRDLLLSLGIVAIKNAPEVLKQALKSQEERQNFLKDLTNPDFKIEPPTKEEPVKFEVEIKPVALNGSNPVSGLTPENLQRIFEGALKDKDFQSMGQSGLTQDWRKATSSLQLEGDDGPGFSGPGDPPDGNPVFGVNQGSLGERDSLPRCSHSGGTRERFRILHRQDPFECFHLLLYGVHPELLPPLSDGEEFHLIAPSKVDPPVTNRRLDFATADLQDTLPSPAVFADRSDEAATLEAEGMNQVEKPVHGPDQGGSSDRTEGMRFGGKGKGFCERFHLLFSCLTNSLEPTPGTATGILHMHPACCTQAPQSDHGVDPGHSSPDQHALCQPHQPPTHAKFSLPCLGIQ